MTVKTQSRIENQDEQEKPLLAQTVALQSYMQELLNEVTWTEPEIKSEEDPVLSEANATSVMTKNKTSHADISIEIDRDILPLAGAKLQTLADLEAEFAPEVVKDDAEASIELPVSPIVEAWGESKDSTTGRAAPPEWAQDSFRALYATHGNLKLIMPLVHVQTVLKAKELVRVEGPLSAFIGYVQYDLQRIPVLDLNALDGAIENCDADDIEAIGGYVAIAENHAVGLYFREINDTHEIETKAVNWRCNDGSGSWVAGVDPQNLSIIVDFNCLCGLL